MKNKRDNIFLSMLVVLTASFFACTAEEEDCKIYAITEGRYNLNENEYVTMKIVAEEETNNSLALLKIENHTESRLGYGTYFSLQYYNKNNWEPNLLHDVFWETIGLGLLAGKAEEEVNIFSFVKTYGNSKKGRYRLTKQFSLTSDWFSGNGDMIGGIILSTEFEIK